MAPDLVVINEIGRKLGIKIGMLTNREEVGNYFFLKYFRLNENDNVTELWLNSINLSLVIEELVSLKQLKKLSISETYLDNLSFLMELKKLESLNLSRNSIHNISNIVNLNNLIYLDLSNNKITDLSRIKDLINLNHLNLARNNIKKIDVISELRNLTSLNISDNNINTLTALSNLKKLQHLKISNNKIKDLPLSGLRNLTSLNLSGNHIRDLSALSSLNKLSILDLSSNKISNISSIINLPILKNLNLSENMISEFTEIQKLKFLESLDLSYNKITDISFVRALPNLKKIDIYANPLQNPPIEITNQGLSAILNYFNQIEEQGNDYIYEAKMLVLGEGGVGKTSLVRKIENEANDITKKSDTTRGISISRWQFNFETENEKKVPFDINMWDFGGQQIYHYTHRFFFSERCLNVIVADTREENTNFNYWLHMSELFGNHAPQVIVINRKYGRTADINYNQLRARFENLKDKVELDLKNDLHLIGELKMKLKQYITSLPHIGSKVPARWIDVREALENINKNYISLDFYLSLCRENGIEKKEDAMTLSGFFHDIGVLLHFIGDDILEDTLFLKPQWITGAIFKIIDDPLLFKNNGYFTRQDAQAIWSDSQYNNLIGKLLQMMKKFFLIYEITETQAYISPQHINKDEPDFIPFSKESKTVTYVYDEFMPRGILYYFIASQHKKIEDQNLVWKNGVILFRQNTRARVIENLELRKIEVTVEGELPRELMTIIIDELDKINSTFNNPKGDKYFPCNCQKCKNVNNPNNYSYKNLMYFITRNQHDIQCKKSFMMVDVYSLIDNVVQYNDTKNNYDRFIINEMNKEDELKNKHQTAQNVSIYMQKQDKQNEIKKNENVFVHKIMVPGIVAVITAALTLLVTIISGYFINEKPIAKINEVPDFAIINTSITIDGGKSVDTDGKIKKFIWFIDKNHVSSEEYFNYTFTKIGRYRIKLQVQDNKGGIGTALHNIVITEPEKKSKAP